MWVESGRKRKLEAAEMQVHKAGHTSRNQIFKGVFYSVGGTERY